MPAEVGTVRAVRVRTPARLHLGLFHLPAGGYGGIGVAIGEPGLVLEAVPAEAVSARGPQAERAAAAARRFLTHYRLAAGVQLTVQAAIPPHVGLGSGTQLELAVGTALACLYGLPADPAGLAAITGRAARSPVGMEVFRRGGFVVHAALGGEGQTRVLPFPPDWAFVLAVPQGRQGLSGQEEARAFQALPPMEAGVIREIHAWLEEELLPGLQERDIRRFGRALLEIQRRVGDYFAPVQGGCYSHPLAPRLAEAMLAAGACAVAQSSWGPTLCALAPAGEAAERVRQAAAAQAGREPVALRVVGPDNSGAVWRWVPCA